MASHCFDSTDLVLFHPTREQTSQLACAGGDQCPDRRNQGAATQRQLHLPILYGRECSYNERKALAAQPNELADQYLYRLTALASE